MTDEPCGELERVARFDGGAAASSGNDEGSASEELAAATDYAHRRATEAR